MSIHRGIKMIHEEDQSATIDQTLDDAEYRQARKQRMLLTELAQIGQLEFGYVDWEAELPQTKERWLKVVENILAKAQLAKVLKHRLNRPELREKIEEEIDYLAHEIVVPITGNPTTPYEFGAIKKYKQELSLFVDHILALIPDNRYNLDDIHIVEEEAKKQERERIIEWGEGICPHSPYRNSSNVILQEKRWYCKKCWQALKGES